MTAQTEGDGLVVVPDPVAVGAGELDPNQDVEENNPKNRARVGSIRPSAMLYTNGIGATIDMPHLAVMPHGLEAWDRIYTRRQGIDVILERRLLELVRSHLGAQVDQLRKPPWAPEEVGAGGGDAVDLGIPGRIFPQWLRCTGCGLLTPVSHDLFAYENTNRYRPDQAKFVHKNCKGFQGKGGGTEQAVVPARYLIACVAGHLDEFPYSAWVHRGKPCSSGDAFPRLRMREWKSNIGPDVQLMCLSCDSRRGMREATGRTAEDKLPYCRGRHAHLDAFYPCGHQGRLMMLGAANQWFPSTLSLLALPREEAATAAELVPELRGLPKDALDTPQDASAMGMFRMMASNMAQTDAFDDVPDEVLWQAVQLARGDSMPNAVTAPEKRTDPRTILGPEWAVLTDEQKYTQHSGMADFRAERRDVPDLLTGLVAETVAVEKLKKVNAFVGFTRIDALDRLDDAADRVAPLTRDGRPTWVPATEDRGEGVFLRFDESVIAPWEQSVETLSVWRLFKEAHRRNFGRRKSKTADDLNADDRFPPPRYWAIHTLSHLLIREAAMSSGYGSASLTERIYAWQGDDEHSPAAGLLISTTASDSEGTLGGLVELAKPEKLEELVRKALRRGSRCSSDPICGHRVPEGKEEFLHGAACHFCLFLSETSCERTNRFLDRRLLLGLVDDLKVKTPGLLQDLVEVR